ncbi:CBS-HotDog domain-containing transcription factor SpxR [Streptococcus pacificus]|uniref:CBS domain-containing protein n=1 Tax=Streptococcus pacificus TaxID=2740577 RepID=A0ABS0ZIU8_9STRE|nr:CBS-HotDog domain-containing transcription factor SpxR [Streptococcus pacificus]MBJ8325927.1 CBS domain-containing protein [Streptococcus pacificus]
MSKHLDILNYLENLPIGRKVSVRSISNRLKVSDGTAYRAIKEAENRGLVETKPRSGTVRIGAKPKQSLNKLTYAEIARISDSEVLAGHSGLGHEFSKFSIGAMTRKNIMKYLVKGGLLIVGDRKNIQLLALENNNAILVTGGFQVSEEVINTSNQLGIPVMVTSFDTFTVATKINKALSNARIKTNVKTVDQIYHFKSDYGFLQLTDTIKDYINLVKKHNYLRFPVINDKGIVVGVVSMRDITGKKGTTVVEKVMTKNPVLTKPDVSLAPISQQMIFEDYDMLPVVSDDNTLLGVVTRRKVMESIQDDKQGQLYTYSEQILSNLKTDGNFYSFMVEPVMIDVSGNLSHGVLVEIIKEITLRLLKEKKSRNIIIEQVMVYFLQAVQVEDNLKIYPRIIAEGRRGSTLDFEIQLQNRIVAKAVVSTKMN